MTTTAPETREFQAEARQVLDLMIHSVYSDRDVFLRELLSNASDALDKRRFESLTRPEVAAEAGEELYIRLTADIDAGTLTIEDDGIGMSRDEVIRYIGTIARSGTGEFAKALKEAKEGSGSGDAADLIGRFGVGFYSAFMVADTVTVVTRRAGDSPDSATLWNSTGDGSYTLDSTERATPGTTITLHLKSDARNATAAVPGEDDDEEIGTKGRAAERNYLDQSTLRAIVRRHSDFIAHPIRFIPTEGEPVTLNTGKAIWMRPASEVTEDEYNEFYKHLAPDWEDPLRRISVSAEGTTQFRALLFIPRHAPLDLYSRQDDADGPDGLRLYARRVLIQSGCKDLVPEWLRFLRGVVDSEDLSLNVSREMLQKDRTVQVIRKAVIRRVLEALRHMKADAPQDFALFWQHFGGVIKEGILREPDRREAILDLCLFETTTDLGTAATPKIEEEEDGTTTVEVSAVEGEDDKPEPPTYAPRTTLDGYLERMPADQEAIFVLAGPDLETLRKSPHLEAFTARNIEVLLLADPVDEWWAAQVDRVREKPLRHVGKGDIELGSEDERKAEKEKREQAQADLDPLLKTLGGHLGSHIREVRVSGRLKDSAACLVGNPWDMSPQMEAALRASGRDVPPSKRVLEVNPAHPALARLKAIHALAPDDERLKDAAVLLHGQALLAEGAPPPDPAEFARTLGRALEKSLG